jgi:hypothetical protein
MVRRQRDELHATVDEQNVGRNQECVSSLLYKALKGRVDLTIGAGVEDFDLLVDGGSCRLHLSGPGLARRSVRIDEHGKARGARQQLM